MKGEIDNLQIYSASLRVVTVEGNTHLFDIQDGLNIIGRLSKTVDIPQEIAISTKDKKMSRRHCGIRADLSSKVPYLLLFDTDSLHGTYLKNYFRHPLSKYDSVYVRHGDEIVIGETRLIIEAESMSLYMDNPVRGSLEERYSSNKKTKLTR